MMDIHRLRAFHLNAEEALVLKFRKHWFVLLRDSIGTILAAFLPAFLLLIAAALGLTEITSVPASLWTFINMCWFLIVWLALSVIWTNYYLDLWMITDKRVVSVDQEGLFRREVTTLPFVNVQDVTVEQHGILETLLNFGTVTVQTAGPTTNNMSIRGVAKPSDIRDKIVKQAESWRLRSRNGSTLRG